jgi:D-alanyl-lipoteichoic acid acyltransferase DltB (MBOAT superfamily)
MLFNSAEFAIFFVIVYGLYGVLHKHYRVQNWLLLAASFLFYGWWDVRFLYLFILTTTVDFYCAIMVDRGRVPLRQRLIESAVLVGSAFLCVTLQWKAVTLVRSGLSVSAMVDWGNLLAAGTTGWGVFLGTLAAVILINVADPWLTSFSEARRRKVFLVGSLVSNFTVLGFFKYYNFFATSFAQLVHAIFGVTPSHWMLDIILPVGISFYTFQSLAYTIDVYRKKAQPIDDYLTLASALSFFPLLVAGPIERPDHLLPQFLHPRRVTVAMFREGIWLMVWGLFKKIVVADNAAAIVAMVFGPYDGANPSHVVPADGLRMLIGVYAFAMQIYGDFSGYSDIARGSARLLGFDIMLNFNLPYFAISPSDFWRRWHISLSTWLRDYLYIPLGGNRGGTVATYRNLFLTMLLGGLWHGAAWTFVLWGMYHGLLLIAYRLVAPRLDERPVPRPGAALMQVGAATASAMVGLLVMPMFFVPNRRPRAGETDLGSAIGKVFVYGLALVVMFHLTCLGWLLFRAQNVTTVRVFLQSILLHPGWSPEAARHAKDLLFYGWFLIAFQIAQAAGGTLNPMAKWPWFVRLNVWLFLLMSLLVLGAKGEQTFIYFAF